MLPGMHKLFHRFLVDTWEDVNAICFQGALRLPVFQITENEKTLGRWDPATRTLSIAAKMLLKHAALEVEEVLKHEMAHQYVDEILKARREPGETAHGQAFRHTCRLLEIDHAARFNPVTEQSPLMRRIQKLLALSESQNIHEAETAMTMARRMMEKYQIELGVETDAFRYQYLGEPRKQKNLAQQFIATILVRYFNVQLVWIPSNMITTEKRVWLMEICGTPANLEIAGYVYDYLLYELEWLWLDHRSRNPMVKGVTAKREFQVGVLRGFIDTLQQQDMTDAAAPTELILLSKEKLSQFFHDRHPNLSRGRRAKYRRTEAFDAGFSKGQQLEIHKGVRDRDILGING